MPIRLLSEKNIRSVVPQLPEIVALVERAYRLDAEGKAEVPTKIGVHPERTNSFLHAMPAWVGEVRRDEVGFLFSRQFRSRAAGFHGHYHPERS
jgi:ornithine cyclodeaminase/alanine dehydrogenase-like protein (mu-crystallin family)